MATLLDPALTIDDNDGDPISGATVVFSLTTTTTSAPVYSDNGLTTPISQPIATDSAGRLPYIYLDPAVTYRMRTYDANGVLISRFSPDPVNPTNTAGTAAIPDGAVTTPKLGDGAVTAIKVGNGEISNAKLTNMTGPTYKMRISGTGPPVDGTPAEATAGLNVMVGDSGAGGTKGLVGAPGAGDAAAGKYWRADGTFHAPVDPLAPQCIGAATVTISGTTPTLVLGFNLTCTYGSATGKWNLAFTVAAAHANYYVVCIPQKVAANDALSACISQGTTPTTAGFQLGFADNTASAQNPVQFRVLVFA